MLSVSELGVDNLEEGWEEVDVEGGVSSSFEDV